MLFTPIILTIVPIVTSQNSKIHFSLQLRNSHKITLSSTACCARNAIIGARISKKFIEIKWRE